MSDPIRDLAKLAAELFRTFEGCRVEFPSFETLINLPRDEAMVVFALRLMAERDCPVVVAAREHVDRMAVGMQVTS